MELIICVDKQFGIGNSITNDLNWNISEDLKHFKKMTCYTNLPNQKNILIAGKNTALSMIKKENFKLENRILIILSTTLMKEDFLNDSNIIIINDINLLMKELNVIDYYKIFIIGGKKIYETMLNTLYIKTIYLTMIEEDYKCDIILNKELLRNYKTINKNTNIETKENILISMYELKRFHEEYQYLELIEKILKTNNLCQTRNSECFSIFDHKLIFEVNNNSFPLLTTKKISLKMIFEELKFMLLGLTNTHILEDKKVNIWKMNTRKDFLLNNNLNYDECDMGPMYGFQLRHFNEEYKGMNENYENKGIDQLNEIIELLANNPHSRRILMTTFNPNQVKEGCLYPCHGIIIQFYYNDNDKKIDLKMYQRSADVMLGLPFNISFYSLFLLIIINIVNTKYNKNYLPGKLIIEIGDAHIYNKEDHINGANIQMNRIPYNFCKLSINKEIKDLKEIELLNYEDLLIENYICHPFIKMEMIA